MFRSALSAGEAGWLGRGRRRAVGFVSLSLAAATVLVVACGRTPDTAPQVIVVVASATRNEPEPVLAQGDLAVLRRAAADSTDAICYVVDPNTGQATEVPLSPRRPDGQPDWGPDRSQVLAANLLRVQHLLSREAADKPFDLLALLAAAVRVTGTPGTLIVVSSGVSTAGGFDLRRVGWDADPHAIAAQLGQRGLLPDLAKWAVVFSGIADTSGDQPALPQPQRTELAAYWLAICRAAGAAACRIDDVTRPDPPSRSTVPVPVVPVPAVTSVTGPNNWSGESIPAAMFFLFNSARLLPGANSILGPLAAQAVSGHRKIRIAGYASPDGGSNAYNLALSRARAMAVRARLISLGVRVSQIVQVRGWGTAGETLVACYRDGHLDEAVCAQLRRVVVLISPASSTT
jgi:outer membrane protein OmpA-like peptidoglycan-associated protein